MQSNSSRQQILSRISDIRNARDSVFVVDAIESEDIYQSVGDDWVACFKTELEAVNGQCILCENENEVYKQLSEILSDKNMVFCRDEQIASNLQKFRIPYTSAEDQFEMMDAGITCCEFLVARTGSVLLSSMSGSGRQMNVFPPVHVVMAHKSQMVAYPTDALKAIREKYNGVLPSVISTVTGPSRTADIEKTLVLGAHGPKEFVVLLSLE